MKSRKSFALDLLLKVYDSSSSIICEGDRTRDTDYIRRRFANEGIRFLTVALPSFGKAIISSIEEGTFTPVMGFKTQKRGGLLPAFLRGWTKHIFMEDGTLWDQFDPQLLQELLQITMLCYKLEAPYSEEQELQVVQGFVNTETEIPTTPEEVGLDPDIVSLARQLLRQVLRGIDFESILPKHGPGAVATGEKGNAKYSFKRKYQRLHQEFPYYRFFAPSLSRVSFESGWYKRLEPAVNPHAKVVLVPKDSRGPRLISMEPLEVQWIQQGVLKKLVKLIESHPLTRNRVNFTKQSFNQDLAYSSSMDRAYSTLDLKDASDRVSVALVQLLYPEEFVQKVMACRSVATVLPNGEILPLRKFAPMGSALCFPMMALTIWALIEATNRLRHQERNCRFLVYGDDVIVPAHMFDSTVDVLHAASLKVNTQKSFHKSLFRESCGMDAYNGKVVTPIRLRRSVECRHPEHKVRSHLIALSESFFDKGLWEVTKFLREYLSTFRSGRVPWTTSHSDWAFYCPDAQICIQRNRPLFKRRWNLKLQRTEFLLPVPKPESVDSFMEDYCTGRLLKALTQGHKHSGEKFQVTDAKGGAVRPRWATV